MTLSRSQTTDLSVPLLVSVQTEEALLSWGVCGTNGPWCSLGGGCFWRWLMTPRLTLFL